MEILLKIVWPIGAGILVFMATYFLRKYLYSLIQKLCRKTTTRFDDILLRDTRLTTLLWCIWAGISTGWGIADTPESWAATESKIMAALFFALGTYTAITILNAIFIWYKDEICTRTKTRIDEIIMWVLIIGTPIIGGALGIIAVLNSLGIRSAIVNNWIRSVLPNIALLTAITVIFLMLTIYFIPKVVRAAVRNSRAEQTEDELEKRADTLISVIGTTLQIFIIIIFFMVIVIQLVSWEAIVPVLTATGVVGVAVGFGAQSLVKDVLAGLFIIMENQYRKGDVVEIAGVSGTVEEINLRRTILRNLDGLTHVVPNGEIRVASNYTKQLSRVNLDVRVSYNTDLDKAMAIINKVGKEMAEAPVWMSLINTPPRALRVNNLGESGIDIKIVGETKPSQQWSVTGELRLRLKKAFDKEGIEFAWPRTRVYLENPVPPQTRPLETGIKVENQATSKKMPN